MKVPISTLLLLSALAALGRTAGINILPIDAATELKGCASESAWYSVNIRWGYYSDADSNQHNTLRHLQNFKEMMAGIISEGIADKIRHMLGYAAWVAANTRVGWHSDAARDEDTVNRLYDEIAGSGELSHSLLGNIRGMGWESAWYSANTRVGYDDDARTNVDRLNAYYDSIHGRVNLVAVRFLNDQFRTTRTAPRVVFSKTLPNCGSTALQAQATHQESVGRTYTFTHTIGFEHSISSGVSAQIGFFGTGGEVNFQASFTFSEGFSISRSFERTTTRRYTFTLTAAPNTTNRGIATVQEATGSVPYEMTFDFGGVQKDVSGLWSGVLVSEVIFKAREVVPHDPSACSK